jgi:hypothetical protein
LTAELDEALKRWGGTESTCDAGTASQAKACAWHLKTLFPSPVFRHE